MALGNSGTATDSPVLVVVSAVAIAVVFVVVMLLIILRARQMAFQRQEAMRLHEEWETQLMLRFKDKPAMHEVWLSSLPPSMPPAARRDDKGKLELNLYEWNKLMPLSAADNRSPALSRAPSASPTYTVGVLLQLPRPRTATAGLVTEVLDGPDSPSASPPDVTLSGSEILFGLSVLPVVERPR